MTRAGAQTTRNAARRWQPAPRLPARHPAPSSPRRAPRPDPLALAPRAEAYVYWANPDEGTIGRANLDGTGVDQSFITGRGPARGVAVDAPTSTDRRDFDTAHDRARQPRRHRREPELHSTGPPIDRLPSDRVAVDDRARLLGEQVRATNLRRVLTLQARHRRDRARQPRRDGSRRETSSPGWATPSTRGRRWLPPLLDQLSPRHRLLSGIPTSQHDRARQPRRHGRRGELHLRPTAPRDWRSTARTSGGHRRSGSTARSGAPTSTARAPRTSSRRSRGGSAAGSRSTTPTSIGPTAIERSGAPSSTAAE